MTDPIADMLTRIRNAVGSRHTRVDLPASKLKLEIARILQDEGYIAGYKVIDEPSERPGKSPRQIIRLQLKYGHNGERVSRPGRRVYAGHDGVPPVLGGLGVNILTTSRGVMTGQAAKKAGVGGEILCNVW